MIAVQGNALVPAVMLIWVPLVTCLFGRIHPRKAAALAFVLGWMFLPVAEIPLKGLPDITKVTLSCAAIIVGAWVHDRDRILRFRLLPVDIPMLLWCTCPLLSSLANGLGAYDGLSETMYQSFTWGLPYFVGRMYFSDLKGLNTLAVTVFAGGLLYIPFCFEEMIMSPQLHRLTYGFHQHSFLQTMRGGGFRPMVFMEHGLMVAMWMISATMLGLWLARAGVIPEKLGSIPFGSLLKKIPVPLLLLSLIVTSMLMKSAGAFVLFIVGMTTLYLSNKLKTAVIIWLLVLVPPTYMVTRTTGWWNGENLTTFISEKLSQRGGQSLQFRFDNEKILVEKAMEGTFFGWGGWNRSRVFDDHGKDISITDGLWIITLGTKGIYGLVLQSTILVLPVLLLLWRSTPEQYHTKEWAAPAAMSVLLLVYMIDCLPNGMVNPIFMLFNGGVCGLLGGKNIAQEESNSFAFGAESVEAGVRYLNSPVRNGRTRFLSDSKPRKMTYEN